MADPSRATTASSLANEVAPAILAAFEDHQSRFVEITRRARGRFDERDWRGSVDDVHFTVKGDEDVARRVMENLVFTP